MSTRGRTERTAIPAAPGARPRRSYLVRSAAPLHVLAFVLPFLICYELALLGVFGDGELRLEAHDLLVRFFQLFDAAGLHLPSIALVTILIVQHIASRDRWSVSPKVVGLMLLESAALTIPLLVLVMLLNPETSAALSAADLSGSSRVERVMLAFSAGLYEEMLFRLIMMTMIHFLIVDTLGFAKSTGAAVALVVSSIAFALYHDQINTPSGSLNLRLAAFYLLSGLYFGLLFLWRGLGIAIGTHLVYDLIVLLLIGDDQALSA